MLLFPDRFHVGPLTIYTEVAGPFVAVLLAIWYLKHDGKRQGPDGGKLSDLVLTAFVFSMIVSRFSAFAIAPAASFRAPFWTLVSGGVPYTDWVFAAVFVGLLVNGVRKYRFSWPAVLASLMRGGVLFMALLPLFMVRVGKPTDLPWGVVLESGTYHPTNLYASAAALAVFLWLWATIHPQRPLSALSRGLFAFGTGMLLVSFFQVHLDVTAGLAPVQWLWLLGAASGYLISLIPVRSGNPNAIS